MQNLILIFSNKIGLDNNGYNFFESAFINGSSLPLLIGSSGIVQKVNDAYIVIIQDIPYSDLKDDNAVKSVLETIKSSSEQQTIKLYLIYHREKNQDFGNENHNKDDLAKFYNEQMKYAIGQSHISGSIYEIELRQIADALQYQKAVDYNKAIEAIIKRFGDPELEAKLELLHKCLTPDGAKTVGKTPNYALIKEAVESVKINGNNKTVVEHLTEQTDCFDEDNYIKPLTDLRDKLLA